MKYLLIGLSLLLISFTFTGCRTVTDSVPASSAETLATPSKTSQVTVSVEEIKFSPNYASKESLRLNDAFKVYNSAKGRATGIYEHQELIFVIINVDYGKEKTARHLAKGTAMLRANKLLRTAYKLPEKYRLQTHQIEAMDFFRKKIYRYAFVCLQKDINAIMTSKIKTKSVSNTPRRQVNPSVPKSSIQQKPVKKVIKSKIAPRKRANQTVFSGDRNISDDF